MAEKHIIINIGRQFGSGGKAIAELIGEKLGIPVYDQELLSIAAQKSGISSEFFKESDEKRRLWGISNIFGANRYGSPNKDGLSDSVLFKLQSETIREIAGEGSAIFVGRASNYVLRDMDCLDVFVWAPIESRIARVMERENVTADKVEAYIEKKDKGRAEYYNFFSLGHWGKAADYDMCIDSSILGIEGTAEFIIEFGRRTGRI